VSGEPRSGRIRSTSRVNGSISGSRRTSQPVPVVPTFGSVEDALAAASRGEPVHPEKERGIGP
jgi:hypothetical protein